MPADADRRTWRAAGATDVGRHRQRNEDRFHLDGDRGVFIVVDGIGGHAAGETAAETAIAALRERLARQTGTVPDRIREAVTIANNEVHRLASTRPDWHGMACVLTVAVIDGEQAVVGHVGDSRLYRLQGTHIEKITPDHSPVGEREDAHELSELEAMRHPRRNEVYRDVGSEPHVTADRDFVFVTAIDLPADAALLLCSDGLTDLVPSDAIRDIALAGAGAPEQVARTLVDAANAAGGTDNITVVFVQGEEFGSGTAGHGQIQGTDHDSRRRGGWLLPSSFAVATLAGVAVWNWGPDAWRVNGAATILGSASGASIVRSNESIMAAIDRAAPGTTVIVEPGEYREPLTLKDNVRVVSRVPRGATLRLPGVASERDVAVIAAGIANAELVGFRIVGDAATPLGVGVMTRNAAVRLVDLEVIGATTAAIDLGAGEGTELVASEIHHNTGAALSIRTGATARVAHNVFASNASSERTPAAFLIERDARIQWQRNLFSGIGPEAIVGTDQVMRSSLLQDNWFVGLRPAGSVRPASGRGARGR
jgi:serine/threonine protein phosphatase PrpC